MGRPKNTPQRQAQIVEGLRLVMAEKGYDGATVAEVARAARLSPGVVHHHFPDKRAILLALVRTLAAEHLARVDARVEEAAASTPKERPRARLWAFIDAHLATGRDAEPETLACWVMVTAEALRDRSVAREVGEVMADLAERLAQLVHPFTREVAETERVGAALLATIQGYYVLAATTRSFIPRGSAAPTARRMAAALLGIEAEVSS